MTTNELRRKILVAISSAEWMSTLHIVDMVLDYGDNMPNDKYFKLKGEIYDLLRVLWTELLVKIDYKYQEHIYQLTTKGEETVLRLVAEDLEFDCRPSEMLPEDYYS